ncbi:MAG TPA: nitrogenase component 1 [Methylomusa anaerophila]|uniref:Nitrogenase molybdenum-iron protein alpha chain n=1 Tax=Methylomusa anaerophila TaxID=1930071 RepID=A0A348AEY7_9FIRM|nr:nitrogenase component 1 [Methylomusa anaerophila]BBB89635.1 nitrogenase molybdenum-iron protein alpha chain [Methylomusa anaerophila]HML89589.1 nitrogenase component 1 [Methylomusa anaerophila]
MKPNSLQGKTVSVREKRLNTLSAYFGEAGLLLQELKKEDMKQRVRTFSQTAVDDVVSVLRLLSGINNVVAIVHGPRGCSASQLYFETSGEFKNRWALTNLNERDTIMGGEASLREAIITLNRRYQPQIIFVIATPVVAINNDDIFSVVAELRAELGLIIVPVYSDGFKSKTGITGYDTALHALIKYLPFKQGCERGNFINLLSITERCQDIREIERMINGLGLEANILPRTADIQNFTKAPRAKVSISINSDYSHYLGQILEENYGVQFLQPAPPIGIKGTYHWLAALGKAVGLEREADELNVAGMSQLGPSMGMCDFTNVKAYINLPTSTACGMASLVEELGAEVVGLTVHHIDKLHQLKLAEVADKNPALQVHVAQGQPFEQANILERLKPDVYIGNAENAVWAAKLGIAAIAVDNLSILGYQGVAEVSHRLKKALFNKSFVQKLKKNSASLYQQGWYHKSPNWYIKLEVK